jgi:hypothetical protein
MTFESAGAQPEVRASGPSAANRGLLRNARTAAALTTDHPDLWAPGALAQTAFLGWLPFMLAIVAMPSLGDLGFFWSSMALAPSFPLNLLILAGAVTLSAVAASVLVATGEAALQRGVLNLLGQGTAPVPTPRSLDEDAARLWLAQLVAGLPALAGAAALLTAVGLAAPGDYQSPDLGVPFALRLARDVWPFIVAEVLLVVAGQAYGATLQRALIGARRSLCRAIGAAARDLVRHAIRRVGLVLAGDLLLAAWLPATWALLAVLWAPIGRSLLGGELLESGSALLLVGFVAIWICLLAAGGALQAWVSTLWSLELEEAAWN